MAVTICCFCNIAIQYDFILHTTHFCHGQRVSQLVYIYLLSSFFSAKKKTNKQTHKQSLTSKSKYEYTVPISILHKYYKIMWSSAIKGFDQLDYIPLRLKCKLSPFLHCSRNSDVQCTFISSKVLFCGLKFSPFFLARYKCKVYFKLLQPN